MQEKSKNMDLEEVPLDTNETVPVPEVEHKKKKKGWTLFRSNKSKSEENAKREIFNEGETTNVKIISVKPKNMDEEIKDDEVKDEKGNPEEIQPDETKKDESIGDAPNDMEIKIIDLPIDNLKQSDENAVPKKRWYQWFGRRSQRKSKLVEVTPDTETTDAIMTDENKAPLAEEEPSKVTDCNEIEEIAKSETLPANAVLNDKAPDEVVDTSEPEKRKRLTLNFFRRSTKKNKKTEKVSPTETVIEEIEIKMENDDKLEDENVQMTDTADNNKIDKTEIVETEALPKADDVKEVVEDPPADEPKEASLPNDNDDKPENSVVAEEKRKRFTFKMFFRRSTKKDEKSQEATPTDDVQKESKINENGPEPEKTEEKDETVKEVPADELKAECPVKNDEPSDIKDVNNDKLPTEEVPVLQVGDNATVGDVPNVEEPKIDEKKQIDDIVEESVNKIVEASMAEVEQK